MDSPPPSTPPSHRSHRHLRLPHHCDDDDDNLIDHHPTPCSRKKSQISPSPLHLSIPFQDLLLLSHSPLRRPKPRPVTEEPHDPASATPRRKGRTRAAAPSMALLGCASPRNPRRARRRLEKDIIREERESTPMDDGVERAARKRKHSRPKAASKKKLSLGSSLPSSSPLPRDPTITDVVDLSSSIDGLRELLLELIIWKNAAKSTLWFGIGSIFFLSSSFSREFGFSITSTVSHLGILILALAFFYDSFPQRQQLKSRGDFQLTEEDIVRAARVVLPVANAVLSKTREIFSGEPSMTLKVAPILLFTAKYGHLITLWRLFATGFFLSFTAPKLYSSYSQQIYSRVETVRNYVSEAWKTCRHKRVIAASTATVFWNLFSAKTRIFAAFISVVILRYHHQQQQIGKEKSQMYNSMEEEQQQAMLVGE